MHALGRAPRLIHLCGFGATHSGSFIPMLSSILRAARERGWAVEAVFPPRAAERYWLEHLREAGIACRIAPGASRRELARTSRRELARWISAMLDESPAPTILHTHFSSYDDPAVLAKRRRGDVVVVWHVHTVLASSPRVYLTNLARFSLFARSVDLILCPARNVADGMIARGAPRRRVEVFPSPIDVDFFGLAGQDQRAAARAEVGVSPDRTVLLHFGRDREVKGTDLFLAAAEALAADDESIYGLLHVGDRLGASQYESVPGCVHLIHPVDDIRTLYACADVLVAPSRGEGMPFAVVECLSSGTPVVASDLPGHRMLARELAACEVVEREPGPIVAATRAMLDRPAEERAAEAAQAHAWIREHLHLDSAASRMIDHYDRLLAQRGLNGRGDSG
jgi:glycosyltransferase involved in cell wall biosynthesis